MLFTEIFTKKRALILKPYFIYIRSRSVAVSCMKNGLMPLSQWALHFYDQINYHDYNSLALDNNDSYVNLVHDLADKIMFIEIME